MMLILRLSDERGLIAAIRYHDPFQAPCALPRGLRQLRGSVLAFLPLPETQEVAA